ncbi:hypothetical protein J7I79_21780, partial [Arthrobacter sp. ISL-69]|nr:hypothetical protein [Arthrobacter sp. ISL-69]
MNRAVAENSGSAGTIPFDQPGHGPGVTLAGGPTGDHAFLHDPAAPTCNASDTTSGLASCMVTGGGEEAPGRAMLWAPARRLSLRHLRTARLGTSGRSGHELSRLLPADRVRLAARIVGFAAALCVWAEAQSVRNTSTS